MKVTIELDCTPQEARGFLGLPDVSGLNEHLVGEMKKRMDANIAMLAPEELMKNWMAFGGQASGQFMKLMSAAADAEDRTEKSVVTPGPLAPARELYGAMLLESGMAKEAVTAFEEIIADTCLV